MVYAHKVFAVESRQNGQMFGLQSHRVAPAHRRRLVKFGVGDLDRRRGGEVEDGELEARRRADEELGIAGAEARNVGLFAREQGGANGGMEGRIDAGGEDVHVFAGADEQPRRRGRPLKRSHGAKAGRELDRVFRLQRLDGAHRNGLPAERSDEAAVRACSAQWRGWCQILVSLGSEQVVLRGSLHTRKHWRGIHDGNRHAQSVYHFGRI